MTRADDSIHWPALAVGALILLACLLVIYSTPRDVFWIVDGGTKALTSERMLETGFASLSFDYPAAELDPTGAAFPIPPPFALQLRGEFISFYPPAYSAISVPPLALLGRAATH